jgi:hypothetical protein
MDIQMTLRCVDRVLEHRPVSHRRAREQITAGGFSAMMQGFAPTRIHEDIAC